MTTPTKFALPALVCSLLLLATCSFGQSDRAACRDVIDSRREFGGISCSFPAILLVQDDCTEEIVLGDGTTRPPTDDEYNGCKASNHNMVTLVCGADEIHYYHCGRRSRAPFSATKLEVPQWLTEEEK